MSKKRSNKADFSFTKGYNIGLNYKCFQLLNTLYFN